MTTNKNIIEVEKYSKQIKESKAKLNKFLSDIKKTDKIRIWDKSDLGQIECMKHATNLINGVCDQNKRYNYDMMNLIIRD